MDRFPWSILRIEPTHDDRAIRRAYAARLKVTNPEDDPTGFMRLREALDAARHSAANERFLAFSRGDAVDIPETGQVAGTEVQDAVSDPPPESGPRLQHTNLTVPNSEPTLAEAATAIETDQPTAEPASGNTIHHLWSALDHLHVLMQRDLAAGVNTASPWDTPEAALERILQDPALEQVDTYRWVEHTIGNMVEATWPHQMRVAGRAAEFFCWDNSDYGGYRPRVSDFIEDEPDQSVLWRVQHRNHEYHDVYRFLKREPDRYQDLWTLKLMWYGAAVMRFLADESEQGQLLRSRLPASSLHYWQTDGLRSVRLLRFVPLSSVLMVFVMWVLLL